MLCGCSGGKEKADPKQDAETDKTKNTGWYVRDSNAEKATGGAVREYRLPKKDFTDLFMIGDAPALMSQSPQTALTVLSDMQKAVPVAALQPEGLLCGVCAVTNALAYFRQDTNEVIYLSRELEQISTVKLPETVTGTPVFAPNGNEIYYCAGNEIRAFDTTLNVSRPIQTHTCISQTLTGVYFGGRVIACCAERESGKRETIYISTQTGETLSEDQTVYCMETTENDYIALKKDTYCRENLVGTWDGDCSDMRIDSGQTPVPAIALDGIMGYQQKDDGSVELSFYSTRSGRKTAQTEVPVMGTPIAFAADKSAECIWILSKQEDTGKQHLYSWRMKESPYSDDAVYLVPAYSEEDPDTRGLSQASEYAKQIGQKHGVEIRVWKDATAVTGDYTITPEYRTVPLDAMLKELDGVLSKFPEKFIAKSTQKKVQICLVRSIAGSDHAVQYWDGGCAYLALPSNCPIEDSFLKAMSYVVSSHILGRSTALDGWNDLNPEGFVYGAPNDEYVKDTQRAFTDKAAMSSVTEDRSSVFYYAMSAGKETLFQGEIMHRKLELLCSGIREAWSLTDTDTPLPWEQYLG